MFVHIYSENLKYYRNQRGWRPEELSEKSSFKGRGGVGTATIKRIERSAVSRRCQWRIADNLSAAFGIEVADLISPIIPRPYDIGGDIILDLSTNPSPGDIRASTEKMVAMLQIRNELLKRDAQD